TGNNVNFTSNNSLQSENSYFFRIQSCITSNNCSDYSPSVSVYLDPIVNKPTNLTAVVNENTGLVDLSWQDNSSNEDGFKINYCKQPFNQGVLGEYSCPLGQGASVYVPENYSTYSFLHGVLNPETTYYFNIRSFT